MKQFERVLDNNSLAAMLVVGNVNSTISCALAAVKKSIPVIQLEAARRNVEAFNHCAVGRA